MNNNKPAARKGTKWQALRRKDGTVTGYIEVMYSAFANSWVTVPGYTRIADALGIVSETER